MARGAMHYRNTFAIANEDATAARAARYAARDAAYRAALGISDGPLPRVLGARGHSRGPRKQPHE